MMQQALYISWDDLHDKSKQLSQRVKADGPLKGIIGVSRSGMIPATLVAIELDLRLLESVCVSSYDHKTQSDVKILKPPGVTDLNDGQGWIIIDDLVDTGETAKALKTLLPAAKIATLYAKPQGMPYTDYYIAETTQDTWIYFPWDAAPDAS